MRRAFSLIEVLVAIFIIAILIALLLPAVQAARSAGQTVQCGSHLSQLGIATHLYANGHRECLPPQGAKRSLGWRYALLPYLEQQALYELGATPAWKRTPERTALHTTVFPVYQCPATEGYPRRISLRGVSGGVLGGARDYYSLHTVQGVTAGMWCPLVDEPYGDDKTLERASHWRTWPTPLRYATDGLSNSIMIYESASRGAIQIKADGTTRSDEAGFDQGWADVQHPWAYAEIMLAMSISSPPINVSNVSSMYADHRGGANALFGDGRVRFLSEAIDPDLLRALSSRDGGEAVSPP